MMDRLQRLAAAFGPAGREEIVAETLRELMEPYVQAIQTDRFGNLIAVRRGAPGGRRVMLSANMDSPGAQALKLSAKGMVGLTAVGNVKAQNAIGQRVVWESGVVGVLQHEPSEPKELDFKRVWCDIGASSEEEAEQAVRPGQLCALLGDLLDFGAVVTGPNLDNRAACAVLVEVAEHLTDCDHEVVFAFTCQGAVGNRGAATAAYSVEPDLAFTVDASTAGDVPGGPKTEVRLGGGPVLRIKDATFISHSALCDQIRQVAAEQLIPLQPEIVATGSGGHTDAQAISQSRHGVPTAIVGLPVRYRGTAGEMLNRRDLHGAADLLLKLLAGPLGL